MSDTKATAWVADRTNGNGTWRYEIRLAGVAQSFGVANTRPEAVEQAIAARKRLQAHLDARPLTYTEV